MKNPLREKVLSIRNSKSKKFHILNSKSIKRRLFKLDEFIKAKRIMFYISTKSEVKTEDIIKSALKKKKHVIVPITNIKERSLDLSELKDFDKELKKGHYDILEPKKKCIRRISPEELDLIIIPGIVFDIKGNRIGYGKGYYDNFLKKIKKKITIIALAYEFQILNNIIKKGYRDIPVDKIITEKRIVNCECN